MPTLSLLALVPQHAYTVIAVAVATLALYKTIILSLFILKGAQRFPLSRLFKLLIWTTILSAACVMFCRDKIVSSRVVTLIIIDSSEPLVAERPDDFSLFADLSHMSAVATLAQGRNAPDKTYSRSLPEVDGKMNTVDYEHALAWTLKYAHQHPSERIVLNLSLGAADPSVDEKTLIDEILSTGAIIVAAAGNDADKPASYPAAYPGVIAVGAADHGVITSYSCRDHRIDAFAQDSFEESRSQSDAVKESTMSIRLQGTSFSAPRVSAEICDALKYSCDDHLDIVTLIQHQRPNWASSPFVGEFQRTRLLSEVRASYWVMEDADEILLVALVFGSIFCDGLVFVRLDGTFTCITLILASTGLFYVAFWLGILPRALQQSLDGFGSCVIVSVFGLGYVRLILTILKVTELEVGIVYALLAGDRSNLEYYVDRASFALAVHFAFRQMLITPRDNTQSVVIDNFKKVIVTREVRHLLTAYDLRFGLTARVVRRIIEKRDHWELLGCLAQSRPGAVMTEMRGCLELAAVSPDRDVGWLQDVEYRAIRLKILEPQDGKR